MIRFTVVMLLLAAAFGILVWKFPLPPAPPTSRVCWHTWRKDDPKRADVVMCETVMDFSK